MAVVSTGYISSSNCYSPYRNLTCDSEAKARRNGSLSCLTNQASTFHGLRSSNNVDMLLAKPNPKANHRRTAKSASNHETAGLTAVIVCRTGLNVVFVGTEASPWSKTGGLGEVLGALPPELASRGHRVMTVTPRYDQYKDAWDTSVVVELKVGNEVHTVRYFHTYREGVDRVFVDHPSFLEKVWGPTGPLLYGPVPGEDYRDNNMRFSLLCQAALEAPRVLSLQSGENYSGPYGEDVVFVCNDWHTALLPCYLKGNYKSHGIYKNAKAVMCIHNISYQGRFPFSDFSFLGLPENLKSSFEFVESYLDGERKINWLKAGLLESDRVLTVSPYYAQEVVTSQFKGMELESILRTTGITGILNGINVREWNPRTDKFIPVKYDATTVKHAKPIIKEALQAEFGLPVDRNIPLIAFIGRLEEQKGPDILTASIPEFVDENVQLVALGTGKKKFEKQFEQLEEKFPNKARGLAKYNAKLAHMIVAGADFVVIPSRFEPAGLIQMEAMQYGTVPIVSSTGGLVDTVKEGYTGFQMGAFNVDGAYVDPHDVMAIASTVKRALGVYATPAFDMMVQNCMAQDFSWKEPARNWEKVLQTLDLHGKEAGITLEEIAPPAREKIATY